MTDSGTIDFEQGQSNSELTDEQKIDYIVDNWDEIAALMEQGARTKQLNDELKTYIGDVKSELRDIRIMRGIVGFVVLIVIGVLMGSLWYFLFCDSEFLKYNRSYTGTAFVIASISATVVLLVTFIRGAFRSIKDRNKDEDIPPRLVRIMDSVSDNISNPTT